MPGKIPLLSLKPRLYSSRIFRTKTRILAQACEFLQPFYLLDHSNEFTAGRTEDKILFQLSKIQLSCVRLSDAKSKLIRQSLCIS